MTPDRFKFISPIINLTIKENVESFNIYSPEFALSQLSDKITFQIGGIELSRIDSHPVWVLDIDEYPSNISQYLHTLNAERNHILGIGFWLLKDCSVMSPFAYILNETFIRKDIRNLFFSNSHGKYINTEFSSREIERALFTIESLSNLSLRINIPEEFEFIDSGPIRGSFNSSPYNDFDLFQRVIQFITLARTTSHIPQKIAWYVVAIEALFGNNEPGEIVHKVSYRTAIFFDVSLEERLVINDKIKLAYGLRSKFLHGVKLDKKHTSENVQIEISTFLDSTLRKIFNTIIDNIEKREIFINSTAFDEFFKIKMFGN